MLVWNLKVRVMQQLGGSSYPIQMRLVVGGRRDATTRRLIVSNTDDASGGM